MFDLPEQWGIEEVDVDGDGQNGNLEKIEETKRVDPRGFVSRARKKDHESRSSPDKEEDVGRPRSLRGTGDKTLVIGTDGLGEQGKHESDGKENPQLAGVTAGTHGCPEGTAHGEQDYGGIERIGDEQAGGSGMNKAKVERQEQRDEKGGSESVTRGLAGAKQENLTEVKFDSKV